MIIDEFISKNTSMPSVEGDSQPLACSARQAAQNAKAIEEREHHNAKKAAALFQVADESQKQNKLLSEQIETLKQQNNLLGKMYDSARAEAAENQKQARQNKIFGWISFAVGTIIGIAGVLVGIFVNF